jgi:C1A family cysteine protease
MSMNQLSAIGTPSSLDWRQQGIVTSVKDQG